METNILAETEAARLQEKIGADVTGVYRSAFALPPYEEDFSDEEAEANLLGLIGKGGDIVVRRVNGTAVSLAGGFPRADGVYQIEELAVRPDYQEMGIGRQTLRDLFLAAAGKAALAFELRTTEANAKAISLYTSEGFLPDGAMEAVASRRKSGRIEIDNRVYLFKPLIEGVMSEKDKLKRVVVAYPSGNTTAVVFDQLLAADRKQLNTQVMENWKKGYSQFPEVEQCCFVTKPVNKEALARVELFGGEFCANATRSVIWMLTGGRDYFGTIEVSGVDRLLKFKVENSIVTLEMPLPEEQSVKEVAEGMLVQLDGIAQLVVTGTEARTPKQLLSELKAGNRYSLAEQPAFGVSYYESATGNARGLRAGLKLTSSVPSAT